MEDLENLKRLAREADRILKEELSKSGISYDMAEARIYDKRSVGVQGDGRTYDYPAEIEVRYKGRIVWDPDFVGRVSTRIPNEIKGINRVVYVLQ